MHLEMSSQSNLSHLFPEMSTLLKAKKNKSMSQCSFALTVCVSISTATINRSAMEHSGLVNACLKPVSGAAQGRDTATEPQRVDEGMEDQAGNSNRSGI